MRWLWSASPPRRARSNNCRYFNFWLTASKAQNTNCAMDSVITFVEFQNQVIEATYRKLMIGATVVLVDTASGQQLSEPVTRIASHLPSGSIRIRLPASFKPGTYFL